MTKFFLFYLCVAWLVCGCEQQQHAKKHQDKHYWLEGWKQEFLHKVHNQEPPLWMLDQVQSDLLSFSPSGVTDRMLDETMAIQKIAIENSAPGDWQLIRYRIHGNRLSIVNSHLSENQQPRVGFMTQILQTLCQCVSLQDMDFIIALGDAVDGPELPAPVFAFTKNINSHKIVLIPDFETLQGQKGILNEVERGIKKHPWKDKKTMAFWRGASTGGQFTEKDFIKFPRSKAVTFSLAHPEVIDAKFSSLVQSPEPDKVREKFKDYFAKAIPVEKHLEYKYQLLIDGNSCAYSRAFWQLFSNCVILKQTSSNIQWYNRSLHPYVHYVPLREDLGDLEEKIAWLKAHDKEAQQIVRNAQYFAQETLALPDVYYYLYLALTEYAKLLK